MVYHPHMRKQQAGNIRRAIEAASVWTARRPEIMRLYLTDGWSQERLAAHYGVTQAAMQKAMKRLDIPSRGRARKGAENGRFVHGQASTLYRRLVNKTACAACGAISDLCVHHRDENHLNNEPANLEVLCMSCHSSHHKAAWWRKKAGQ